MLDAQSHANSASTSASSGRIEVTGVTKTYASGAGDIRALEDVELTVEPGEFISLVGPSGCGKSTLLRCIGGLIPPSSGAVAIDGVMVDEPDPRIGYVFQKAVLLPWRSITENVLLPFDVHGTVTDIQRREAQRVLEMVGLGEYANHRPGELSGGMQQRISVARALVTEPSILLMDEPFGALDAQTREHMNVELLRIWRKEMTTVVFVTHDIGEAIFLSDRVVIMSARPGRIRDVLDIDIPRPRAIEGVEADERFWQLRHFIRDALK